MRVFLISSSAMLLALSAHAGNYAAPQVRPSVIAPEPCRQFFGLLPCANADNPIFNRWEYDDNYVTEITEISPSPPPDDPVSTPIDDPEDPPTDPVSDPPTDPVAEPPTDPVSEPPTDPVADPPTDPVDDPPKPPHHKPPKKPHDKPPKDPENKPPKKPHDKPPKEDKTDK